MAERVDVPMYRNARLSAELLQLFSHGMNQTNILEAKDVCSEISSDMHTYSAVY